jgi:uncharacterized protein YndB with AHSA1/START domain
MKFSTREDIEAPIEKVFAEVTDFAGFEHAAMRRNIKFTRSDTAPRPGPGSGWTIDFKFRGRARRALVTITRMERPTLLETTFESGGITGTGVVEMIALSPSKTRIAVALEMTPQTLAARLMLQSLKIAKTGLTTKFKARITQFATDLESRLKA